MHWLALSTALFVYIIVLIVPGPNMVIVYNYSIQKKYNASILSGVGYGLAATTLAALSYVGVSALKDKFVHFEELMFMISGALLIWFGYKVQVIRDLNENFHEEKSDNIFSYILAAFMLNILNPKAIALLTSIYGGILAQISLFEAILFICFCLMLEVFWYYILYYIFSSRIIIALSSRFISKITYLSKVLLIIMGGYFVLHSLFVISFY